MDPILSHISALEYWRSVRIGSRSFRFLDDAAPVLAEVPKKSALAEPGPWWLTRPLHVLVSDPSARRSSSEIVCRVQSAPLPPRSILDSCNGFCVVSPELCFVQMASLWSLPKTIELGYELCGTYDMSNDDLVECQPLTTIEKLAAFVESAQHVYGRKQALRALRYIANGSASPRETILTMSLCLPYALGGYCLPMPRLNHHVDLNARARRIAGRGYVVCDLCWPDAKLDVEYDGGLHAEPEQVAKDSMRRDALLSVGFKVITVTKGQLNDGGEMNAIAHVVGACIGKKLRYRDPQFTKANIALRRELLGRP